ncbi:MAG: YceI family protein [Saprospirales bacterium]|jgi:polyisoprenoid-binding protein YceI|nr:YceI family protein [Saprospirales bacterium]
MKKIIISSFILILFFANTVNAQEKYFTRSGAISFNAEGALDDVEEIRANTNTATCVIDAATGQMEWAVLMKSFQFKNALMQEHFNENYVESSKYPKASFKGIIENPLAVNWGKDGSYPVTVKGQMTLHGVVKEITSAGVVTVSKGIITAASDVTLMLGDYDIEIPALVGNKVSKEVKVRVDSSLYKLVQ